MNSIEKKHLQLGTVISFSTSIVEELKILLKTDQEIEFLEILKLAQKEKFLDKSVINDLHMLRMIRNRAAHDHNSFTDKHYLTFIGLFNKNIKLLRELNQKSKFEVIVANQVNYKSYNEHYSGFKKFDSPEYRDEIVNLKQLEPQSFSWWQLSLDSLKIAKYIAAAGILFLSIIRVI